METEPQSVIAPRILTGFRPSVRLTPNRGAPHENSLARTDLCPPRRLLPAARRFRLRYPELPLRHRLRVQISGTDLRAPRVGRRQYRADYPAVADAANPLCRPTGCARQPAHQRPHPRGLPDPRRFPARPARSHPRHRPDRGGLSQHDEGLHGRPHCLRRVHFLSEHLGAERLLELHEQRLRLLEQLFRLLQQQRGSFAGHADAATGGDPTPGDSPAFASSPAVAARLPARSHLRSTAARLRLDAAQPTSPTG